MLPQKFYNTEGDKEKLEWNKLNPTNENFKDKFLVTPM